MKMYQMIRVETRDIDIFYIMDVNINLYKYFFEVIEEQSVSKAAEKLGVSQPTVSYSIHALQRELGEQLFTIERNGVVPMRRALILYQKIKPAYMLLMEKVNQFIQSRNKPRY